jgi:predicted dehydrogenase
MGSRYLDVAEHLGLDVVAAMDPDPDAYALRERPSLSMLATSDRGEFWNTPMDIVAIASTATSHLGYLEDGLRNGVRRLVVEKPLCDSVAKGEAAVESVRRAGARVVVNHGRRYSPNVATLSALDRSPEMGSLRAVDISIGASGLGCVGTHFFDLCNQLFGGPPLRVAAIDSSARTPPNPRGGEFFDPGGCALLEYSDGRRATIDTSDDCGVPLLIEYRFTYGRVIVTDESENWMIQRRTADARELPLSRYVAHQETCPFPNFKQFGLHDMVKASLQDALGDGLPVSGIAEALEAVRVFAAIRTAARTGTVVDLPLSDEEKERAYPIP